ncbi:MAG: enoyl-CoA hydratase-related protein [Acidobacteriota bacterium]|nr:enoyl-CoA hydratase-related protein [Acidobacteriota bacterium]
MPFRHILFEEGPDGVALVTVNRPEKRNALNRELIEELNRAFETVESDSQFRALILTGAGGKAFIAGADIRELAATNAVQAEALSGLGQRVFRRLETMRKPSVAAIDGSALGGGLELAMCCAVRFATPEAVLGQPEVKLGTVPGYGATQRLPRLVGRGRALEMLLSAEPVTAAEAYRIGLVNRIIPQPDLIPASREWLAKCLACGAYALSLTMEAVDAGLNGGLEAGLRFESAAFGLVASTQDRAEGIRAFLEKRSPVFTGS